MVEKNERVKKLEEFRLKKDYQGIFNEVKLDETNLDKRIHPILIDAARGMIKRTVFPGQMADIHYQLSNRVFEDLTNSGFVSEIDKDNKEAVSYRRSISRYLWEMGGFLPNFRQKSLDLLNSADNFVPEDDWRKFLIEIERAKYNKRVDLNKLLGALRVVSKSDESNADAKKAVLDWSMEAVWRKPWLVSKIFLAAEYGDHKLGKKEKTKQIFRTCARVIHEQIHKGVIKVSRWSLGEADRDSISNQLLDVSRNWVK